MRFCSISKNHSGTSGLESKALVKALDRSEIRIGGIILNQTARISDRANRVFNDSALFANSSFSIFVRSGLTKLLYLIKTCFRIRPRLELS